MERRLRTRLPWRGLCWGSNHEPGTNPFRWDILAKKQTEGGGR